MTATEGASTERPELLADYSDLPESVKPHLEAFEDYIGETDGKSVVTWAPEPENACVDDGTIDASEAVTAFNGIVAVLRSSPDSKLEAYRKALEEIAADCKTLRGDVVSNEGSVCQDIARNALAAGGS